MLTYPVSTKGVLSAILIFILGCLVSCHREKGNPVQPLANPLETDSLQAIRADSLELNGFYQKDHGNYDSARVLFRMAIEIREEKSADSAKLIDDYYAMGECYMKELKYDAADTYFERGRTMADIFSVPTHRLIGLYKLSISCKVQLRDFNFSNSLIQRLQHLSKEQGRDDPELTSWIYQRMAANFYYHGDITEAVAFQKKSISLLSNNDYEKLGTAHLTLGQFLAESDKPAESLPYFDRSIRYRKQYFGERSEALARAYMQKGFVLQKLGFVDSARYAIMQNLSIQVQVNGQKHVNTYGALFSLAEFELAQGQYDSAIVRYQQSLNALLKNFNNHQVMVNPRPPLEEISDDLIKALVGKAKCLNAIGLKKTDGIDVLDLSLKTYLLADSVFAIHRSNLLHDDAKFLQLELERIPYDDATSLSVLLFEKTHDDQYFETAFNLMERSRAVVLQTSLSRAESYNSAGVDPDSKRREDILNKHRFEVLRQINLATTQDETDSLHRLLLTFNDQLARLQFELQVQNPNYANLKYTHTASRMVDVQRWLADRESVLIEFMWTRQGIYGLLIGEKIQETKFIPIDSSLLSAWGVFTKELRIDPSEVYDLNHFKAFCNSSYFLYSTLLKDLIEGVDSNEIPNVIISGDGLIGTLPFDALISSLPDLSEVNYRLPFLVRDYRISNTYSFGTLMQQSKSERHGKKLMAMGFAGNDSEGGIRNNLADLPGTVQEVMAIKRIMKNDVNQYFLEGNASEQNFKKSIPDFNIVHLALHGVGDTLNAMESRIIFRVESDSLDDGRLYAHELYGFDLRQLDLVVLSACESGIGKHQVGEGVMSIARGFAYAGCPSQIISLWKIDDRHTAAIMGNFYSNISEDQPLNEALSNAKVDYITESSELTSHPVFWAAFLLVGDTRAPGDSDRSLAGVVLFVLALAAGLTFVGRAVIQKVHRST